MSQNVQNITKFTTALGDLCNYFDLITAALRTIETGRINFWALAVVVRVGNGSMDRPANAIHGSEMTLHEHAKSLRIFKEKRRVASEVWRFLRK